MQSRCNEQKQTLQVPGPEGFPFVLFSGVIAGGICAGERTCLSVRAALRTRKALLQPKDSTVPLDRQP